MPLFRATPRLPSRLARSHRPYATRIAIPFAPPPVPVLDQCPAPTCPCAPAPAGLDIEREQNINGSIPSYAEQILLCTGRSDWPSRIETEESADGEMVRRLKGLLGPKGKLSDPYHNVLLTHSSIPPTASPTPSAFLLPSFTYLPTLPADPATLESLLRAFVLPTHPDSRHPPTQHALLRRQSHLQPRFPAARPAHDCLILICGHAARDSRCGALGPLLQHEFELALHRQNIPLSRDAPAPEPCTDGPGDDVPAARVAQISHIGGHQWAGNVIVYLPPSWTGHLLRGMGIWYGRVGPEQVEGIVRETVRGGRVIREIFRGGIEGGRGMVRL